MTLHVQPSAVKPSHTCAPFSSRIALHRSCVQCLSIVRACNASPLFAHARPLLYSRMPGLAGCASAL
eukprot:5104459-Pleurochrysis_carterae.AAC.1